MGSMTVYRSTLMGSNEVSDKVQSYLQKILGRLSRHSNPAQDAERSETAHGNNGLLIRIPRATLTGLRTIFGGDQRTGRTTAATNSTQDSDFGLMEADYHAHIKKQVSSEAKTSRDNPHSV